MGITWAAKGKGEKGKAWSQSQSVCRRMRYFENLKRKKEGGEPETERLGRAGWGLTRKVSAKPDRKKKIGMFIKDGARYIFPLGKGVQGNRGRTGLLRDSSTKKGGED